MHVQAIHLVHTTNSLCMCAAAKGIDHSGSVAEERPEPQPLDESPWL